MTNNIAQITNPALGSGLQGETGVSFFQRFVPNMVGLAFVIGALIFFFIMVIAAIQWITSGGDKQALESARGKLTNAIVGFVILLLLFVILKIIQEFFGLSILSLDIGPLKI
jgi:hypothetical protein